MVKDYFTKVLDGMAKGLFASLIIGTILQQIGIYTNIAALTQLGQLAKLFMGPCIGIGIGMARQGKQFTVISAAIAGAIGAGSINLAASPATIAVGEPMGAMIASLVGIEVAKMVEGKSKFDLFFAPAAVILAGGFTGIFISPFISSFMSSVGSFINQITLLQPLPMGILLGVVVGMILTLPISSAALCIAIGINGLAAGAALAGCCAQMVGFAVCSYRENKVSGLLAQGLGTSMLQVPNIIKNPYIWLPPTLAGAVCGGLATMVFKLETTAVGAGMGTAGLVGQLTTLSVMGDGALVAIVVLHFLIPAVISLVTCELMRKKGLIRLGDMKL